MSTRYSLSHDDSHQLYLEIFEPGAVRLTLIGADFEAGPGRVTVAIPEEVWERIRRIEIPRDVWGLDEEPGAAGPSSGDSEGATAQGEEQA